MDFASNREPQARRQVDGGEHQSFELVPPEAFRPSKTSGGDEDRGGYVVSLQQGTGLEQIVCVAVIESEDDAAPRSVAGRECPRQIAKEQGPSVSPDHFEVFGEVSRADGKLPGVASRRGDAMVHEHERVWGQPASRAGQGSLDEGRSEGPHGKNHTPGGPRARAAETESACPTSGSREAPACAPGHRPSPVVRQLFGSSRHWRVRSCTIENDTHLTSRENACTS